MKITKSGFYKAQELGKGKLLIGDGLEVTIFDDLNFLEKIEVGANSKLYYFSYFSRISLQDIENKKYEKTSNLLYENSGEGFLQKHFKTIGKNSIVHIQSFLFAKNTELKTSIFGEIACSKSKIDIHIVSLASEKSFIDLDGQIKIQKGIKEVEGYLKEENIFLGNNAKIRGIPTLLVRSDDVQASHNCKIEKISDEKLFYLRSRGLGKENALSIMIESYVKKIFGNLKEIDANFYAKILERVGKDIG